MSSPRSFDRAQIVALIDSAAGTGHTIGRVWSKREREWLYFDVWGPVTVFRLDSAGRPSMIVSRNMYPGAVDPVELAGLSRMYDFTAQGRVFNEYPSTLAAFFANRLGRARTARLWIRSRLKRLPPRRHQWAAGLPAVGHVHVSCLRRRS